MSINSSLNSSEICLRSFFLSLLGEKKAYMYANNLKKKILRKLQKNGKNAIDLTRTIEFILERKF
jgi:hypothetical protein